MNAWAKDKERVFGCSPVLHRDSHGVLGSPRIWEYLVDEGEACSLNRVALLMRADGGGIFQQKRWRKKGSGERPYSIRNHLAREFAADAPKRRWVTNVTYIRTCENWLYLCVILELYSKLVVGWFMSHRQTTSRPSRPC